MGPPPPLFPTFCFRGSSVELCSQTALSPFPLLPPAPSLPRWQPSVWREGSFLANTVSGNVSYYYPFDCSCLLPSDGVGDPQRECSIRDAERGVRGNHMGSTAEPWITGVCNREAYTLALSASPTEPEVYATHVEGHTRGRRRRFQAGHPRASLPRTLKGSLASTRHGLRWAAVQACVTAAHGFQEGRGEASAGPHGRPLHKSSSCRCASGFTAAETLQTR